MCSQRASPCWMSSQVMSACHHHAREIVENDRQHQPRDDGRPKRVQWILHVSAPRSGTRPASPILAFGGVRRIGRMDDPHPYSRLTPDLVLNALEARGLRCDGRLLALNSYENRVYQVGVDDGGAVVAKFYRPNRWSDEQILEEHAFAVGLAAAEIPVVAPLALEGATLHHDAGFAFAAYPRRGGRAPELEDEATLEWLGRFIGRIHAVGATRPFRHRPALGIAAFGEEPRAYLLASGLLSRDLLAARTQAAEPAMPGVAAAVGR